MADKGGLSSLEGLSTSDDVLSNLQNEIANRQKQQASEQNLWKGASSLGLLSGDANQITNAMNARNQQADSLFNMRQQLAQSKYLKGMGSQANQMFAGFDPETAASLQAQYALDPSGALKAATDLRSKNAELTGTQKENKAAGLSKEDIYRKTLGSDFDLDTFGQKEGIKSLFDLEKLGLTQGHDFALAKEKAGLDFQKDKTLQDLKFDREYGGKTKLEYEQHKSALEDATKGAKAAVESSSKLERLQAILHDPNFVSGALEDSGLVHGARTIFTPQTAKLQEEFEALSKSIVLPSAKQLGSNPSNRDAQIIENTIGSLRNTVGGNVATMAEKYKDAKVAQAHLEFIKGGGSEAEWVKENGAGAQAEIKAFKDVANQIATKYGDKSLLEKVNQLGGTTESSSTGAHPTNIQSLLDKYK